MVVESDILPTIEKKRRELMETIWKQCNISKITYYRICKKLGRKATREDVEEHKRTAKVGRPAKYK